MTKKELQVSSAAYFWLLFFLPLVLTPDSGFGRFHANQALLNLIWGALMYLLMLLLPKIAFLFGILMILMSAWGIVFTLMGQERPLPLIGRFTILR